MVGLFLEPPSELGALIFPWVEQELAALDVRQRSNRFAKDIALKNFLELLVWLRRVLLQDAAVLYTRYPNAVVFRYPPFSSSNFHTFAITSTARIRESEEQARLAFMNLPDRMITSLRGAVTGMSLDWKERCEAQTVILGDLYTRIDGLQTIISNLASSRPSRRKGFTSTYFFLQPSLLY